MRRREVFAVALLPLFGCAHATSEAPDFLSSLRAEDASPLSDADYAAGAQRLNVEERALRAVVSVQSGRLGGFSDGRPVILFEPHIFSRRTNRRYDESHPDISYPTWSAQRYPRTQAERWDQVARAYALDQDAALESTSWGIFQLMGFNYAQAGFPNVHAFAHKMARSQRAQLNAWTTYIDAIGLSDELRARDWAGFTQRYNGTGQVERYVQLLNEAYDRLGGS